MQIGRMGFKRSQRGATFLGILVICAILGVGIYAGIRLVPLYMEYFAVSRALSQVATGGDTSPAGIRKSLQARWDIEDIKNCDITKDIEIMPVGAGVQVRAQYEARTPFIANVSLVVDFEKSVTVGGGAAGI